MKTETETRCPECNGPVTLREGLVPAEIVVCDECSSELEVVATDPVTLAVAPEVEEDWGE